LPDVFQSPARKFGVEDVKVRVYLQSTGQKVLGLRVLGQGVVDHAGMKQKKRIVRMQNQRFVQRFGRVLKSPVLV
jgi:hypothetical protein